MYQGRTHGVTVRLFVQQATLRPPPQPLELNFEYTYKPRRRASRLQWLQTHASEVGTCHVLWSHAGCRIGSLKCSYRTCNMQRLVMRLCSLKCT